MTIHESVYVAEGARILGKVTVGADCGIWYNAVLRGDESPISVGAGTNIQDCCILHGDMSSTLTVGSNVTVGHGAILHGCAVEDGALIGMGATILDGARVGKDAMVAAGALVPPGAEIPDGMLAVGCPAKVKRALTPEEIQVNHKNTALYVKLAQEAKAN